MEKEPVEKTLGKRLRQMLLPLRLGVFALLIAAVWIRKPPAEPALAGSVVSRDVNTAGLSAASIVDRVLQPDSSDLPVLLKFSSSFDSSAPRVPTASNTSIVHADLIATHH